MGCYIHIGTIFTYLGLGLGVRPLQPWPRTRYLPIPTVFGVLFFVRKHLRKFSASAHAVCLNASCYGSVLWPILLGRKFIIVWPALDQCIKMEVQRR